MTNQRARTEWFRRLRQASLVFVLFAMLPCAPANAAEPLTATSISLSNLYQQRETYRKLVRLIETGQHGDYRQQRDALADYALYPYLEYTYAAFRLSALTPESLSDFEAAWWDTPLPGLLKRSWLRHLGKRGSWQMLARQYDPEVSTKVIDCYFANAQYHTGQVEAAHATTRKLWLVAFSQPDACDAAFETWTKANQIDAETAWTRFLLALARNNTKLATYLLRFLPKTDRAIANRFRQVHRQPGAIKSHKNFATDDPRNRQLILHGVKRLARRNPADAYKTLEAYSRTHNFGPEELNDAWVTVSRHLATDYDGEPLIYQVPVTAETSSESVENSIRFAIRQLDWSQVLIGIHQLPVALQDAPRWRYWAAQVLRQSAEVEEQMAARGILAELASTRSFYGFMAADQLDAPYDYRVSPGNFSENEISRIDALPAVKRARELLALDLTTEARREWRFTVGKLPPRQMQIAAHIATHWGWHNMAILTAIDAEAWDDLGIRFPLAHRDLLTRQSLRQDIPLSWPYAIIRQESAFRADARSSAGALGLMQLMPATAQMVAGKTGLRLRDTSTITDPATNIRLGTAYLGQMLRTFEHNRVLASAAYNAGPARVQRWRDADLPVDVWIETIPFRETRDYVQNVLVFAAIYGTHLGEPHPLIYPHEYAAFAPGTPPVLASGSEGR